MILLETKGNTYPLNVERRMTKVITSRADYERATDETVHLHEGIAEELKADIRERAEGHALAVHLLTCARIEYLKEHPEAWHPIAVAGGYDDLKDMTPEDVICRTCGLPLDEYNGQQCYNQSHDILCDVFHEYADAANTEGCEDEDCAICCDCARCASGEVRHCPECGANEDENDEGIDKDCATCEGTGAVSRSRA